MAREKDLETCLRVLAQGSRALVEERDLDRLLALAVDVATRLTGAAGVVAEAGGARAALGLTVDPEGGRVLRVPVVVGGEPGGFVAVIAHAGEAFDDTDELLLLTVASRVATACSVIRASEDARLTETRDRLEENLRQAAPSEPPRRTSSFAPPSSDAETILVVEDDPQVRRLTGGILKRLGFRVLEAPDGVLALHVAAEFAGPIHLLVTDVIMPQMGGRELAERLSVVRPDTRILFVSGYTDDAVLHEGIRNSGIAFLPKPFTAEGLTQMVRGVLDAPS